VIGVDVLLRGRGERAVPSRLTLLCKDPGGYQNVTNLVTRAWLEGQDRGVPLLDRSWLDASTTSGLIALSGAAEGDVGRALLAGREPEAETLARDKAFTEEATRLKPLDILGGISFYDEVQRFETHLIKMALAETGGNQAKAARLLGIKATTLNSKIKLFNIEIG